TPIHLDRDLLADPEQGPVEENLHLIVQNRRRAKHGHERVNGLWLAINERAAPLRAGRVLGASGYGVAGEDNHYQHQPARRTVGLALLSLRGRDKPLHLDLSHL